MQKRRLPKILVLEPYYDGSHRQFLDGLQEYVEAEYTLLVLPARKWKMRMQLSAPWFAEKIGEMGGEHRFFDTVLCSTFVDVSVFRALVQQLPGWNRKARFCTYFHENQFAYPGRRDDPAHHQFTAINFTSAVASDSIAFNSRYNRDTFFDSSRKYVNCAVDMSLSGVYERARRKSLIIHPGLDYRQIDSVGNAARNDIPVIVWNHRWEHDKNPEEFFSVLYRLRAKGIPFQLILLGQSFRSQPACFRDAWRVLADRIIHFGYAESAEEYASLLHKGDVVVSTAIHEFFGISVLEAVRAGCVPLLPNRLSYPELFSAEYLYNEGELEPRLAGILRERVSISAGERIRLTEGYDWKHAGERYRSWLTGQGG